MTTLAPTSPATPVWTLMTGTLTKYVLLAVNITIGVFLMPFTVRHLGTAEYGLWMLVASFTGYFQLLDLGYGSGLVRHVADADARHDVNRVNEILSTFLIVYASIGLLAALGAIGIVFLVIPGFPTLSPQAITRAQLLLAIMAVRTAIGFPMTVFGAVTTARQRFALNNLVAIVVVLVNAAVTYSVLAAGGGLLHLVTATTILGIVSYIPYVWTARKVFPEMQLRAASFNAALVKDVTTFSVYLFLIDVAVQIGFNLDNVVVGAALGTSAVAVYAVALRLADYQRQLCNQFNSLLFPVVVRFEARRDVKALRDMLIEGTRIALLLVAGVTVCVIGLGRPLVSVWMGPGFEGAIVPLYVLAITGVVLVGQGPIGTILLGGGRHRLVALVALGEALINLALSLVLVRSYGLLGVAIGTALPIVVANLFILLPAACRLVGLPLGTVVRRVAVAPLIAVVPAGTACLAIRLGLPLGSLGSIFVAGGVVGLIYLASLWTLGLDRESRERYARFFCLLVSNVSQWRRGVTGGTVPVSVLPPPRSADGETA